MEVHEMSFAENLKQLRKEKHLSQEELAEILDVSRQAVSKWEQGNGYPEVEKLLILSSKLNISLDSLMSTEIAQETNPNKNVTGTIVITSPHENVIATCYKVVSSGKMFGGKTSPKYALFGISKGIASFWGEPTTFLGWYKDKEQITNEVCEIQKAIIAGMPAYTLKFSAKTERSWNRIKIVDNTME